MSNRYRLIKEYPGSPSLGTIKDSEKYIPAMEHMKNYPEFWEEVVEKAEEYILYNKPCLSLNDLKNLGIFNETDYCKRMWITIKELVQQKK